MGGEVQTTPGRIAVGRELSLAVLGCDGTHAGPGGASSGYLISTQHERVWLDTGPGTLGRVQRHVALTALTAVIVTHEHPDHCGELPVLRNALKYVLDLSGLPVLTTAGTRTLVDHISDDASPTFAWDVVAGGDERQLGDLRRGRSPDARVRATAVTCGDGDGGRLRRPRRDPGGDRTWHTP